MFTEGRPIYVYTSLKPRIWSDNESYDTKWRHETFPNRY